MSKGLNKFTRLSTVFLFFAFICNCPRLMANETATITVHRGEDHKFLGLGAGRVFFNDMGNMSQTAIDSANKLVYGGDHANFRACRIGVTLKRGVSNLKTAYSKGVNNLKTIQPGIRLLFDTHASMDDGSIQADMPEFVHNMMIRLRYLVDSLGVYPEYLGAINEPNNNGTLAVDDNHIVELIKIWNDSLTQSTNPRIKKIRLIAPENSNVNDKGTYIKLIQSTETLNILYGFGYHSYNFSLDKEFVDLMKPYTIPPYNKVIWQTEGGSIPVSGGEQGDTAVYNAVSIAGNCLADINLLANIWHIYTDFIGMSDASYQQYLSGVVSKNTLYQHMAHELLRVVKGSEIFVLFLKYFYLREISKALPPNTGLRQCTSDLQPWEPYHDPVRFEYLVNTKGERPQLNSACGVDTLGHWGLTVINKTGLVHRGDTVFNNDGTVSWLRRYWAPAATYDVTFHVEELANAGNVKFSVTRCNPVDTVKKENDVTMQNGNVTVSVKRGEMVTLKQKSEVRNQKSSRPAGRSQNPGISVQLTVDRINQSVVRFVIPAEYEGLPVALGVYDTRGRLIQTLFQGNVSPGLNYVVRDRGLSRVPQVANGIAYVTLSVEGKNVVQKMVMY